jgi:hypothetical protein
VNIYIDLATKNIIRGVNYNKPVTELSWKRGDSETTNVYFVSGSSTINPSISDLRFGIKEAYDGDFLVYETGFAWNGNAYQGNPEFGTVELDAAISGKASIVANAEITWSIGGIWGSTNTVEAIIHNDVCKLNEGLTTATPIYPLPDYLVLTTGNQTIQGAKNFLTRPTVNGTGVMLSGEASSTTLPTTLVYTTGNQTISGTKTFASTISANINGSASSATTASFASSASTASYASTAGVSVLAGDGLAGGGALTSNVTLSANNTVVRTSGTQTISGVKTFANNVNIQGAFTAGQGADENQFGIGATMNVFGDEAGINNFGNSASVNNNFGAYSTQNYFGTDSLENNYYSGSCYGPFVFDTRPTINGTGVMLSGDAAPMMRAKAITGSGYTLLESDASKYLRLTYTGACAITVGPMSLPADTEVSLRIHETIPPTIATGEGVVIYGTGNLAGMSQYDTFMLRLIDTNTWDLI